MPSMPLLPAAALLAAVGLVHPVAAQTAAPPATPVATPAAAPGTKPPLFYPPQFVPQSVLPRTAGSADPAARPACPMGRTASGACVNPYVARAGINAAIAFGQANISETEHPFPATQDTTYAYPNNVGTAPPLVARQARYNGLINNLRVLPTGGALFNPVGTLRGRVRGE